MGSYSFRPCMIEANGDGVRLVIPKDQGHFFALKADILPSDHKGEVTVMGKLSGFSDCTCDTCKDTNKLQFGDCANQPVIARLKKKGRTFSGTAYYYIWRSSYKNEKELPSFQLGNKIRFRIRRVTKP